MIRRGWAALALLAALGVAVPAARAQTPEPDPIGDLFTVEAREADPNKAAVYGYFAVGIIWAGLIFVVCRSSRR